MSEAVSAQDVAGPSQYCRLMDARAQREVVSGPEADDIRLAKRKATKSQYYQNNRGKCIAATRLYYAKNKQKIKENHDRWFEANREKWREYYRRWQAKNREKCKKANREWRVKNRNAINEKQREYYVKNRNAILEKKRRVYECRIRGKISLAPVEPQTPRTPPPRDADEAVARKPSTSREMLLWMTPSEAPRALQASECSTL